MTGEIVALLGLAVALLTTVIASTWRLSALSSTFLVTINEHKRELAEVKAKHAALDKIPAMEQRLGQVEGIVVQVPKVIERVVAVEQAVKFSKELRQIKRGSRPDIEDEDE